MNALEVLNSIGLGTAIGLIAWIFRSGRLAERMQQTQDKAKKDSDGIAKMLRDAKSQQERRWKHEIADSVEEANSQDKRDRLARRIREDAWWD